MAAKPKGIWVIAEANHTWDFDGQQPTNKAAWYVELEGSETIAQATERATLELPLKTKVWVVSDTNVSAYAIAPSLTPAE